MAQRVKPPRILLLDDDILALQSLQWALGKDYEARAFSDPVVAENELGKPGWELAILDLNLRGGRSGLEVLQHWKRKFPGLPVLLCSGEVRVDRAIECLRSGAADYLMKPFRKEDLRRAVGRILNHRPILKSNGSKHSICVGHSAMMQDVLEKVRLLRGKTHLNVMLLGESGTGKEVIARLLHEQEAEAGRPWVVANMPAIPAALMEAELFGVEKGAYTDAKISRAGKFELANGGDIFLDEIGDLPIEAQPKILRVLQERQIERVGATRPRDVKFRTLCATNRALPELLQGGKFRDDLLYRLCDVVIHLPPLRERPEDVLDLANHFIRKVSPSSPPELGPRAIRALRDYTWPGNVRQLESTLKRALAFNTGPLIHTIDIYDPSMAAQNDSSLSQVKRFERQLIENTLRKHGGSKAKAMEELRLSRATFYRKLRALNLH
jgi:DNA-binding NtrC family response regulator